MKKYYALSQIFNNTSDLIIKNLVFSKVTLLICLMVLLSAKFTFAQGPDIDIWYGDVQSFGQEGIPQPWVNILGKISNANGTPSMYYTLNGGSNVTLSIGPDNRRLQSSGDFNIDLATIDLIDGANSVIITATDNNGQTVHPVTVNYTSNNIWPLPYGVDWQSKAAVNDVSQAVDGEWEITLEGIHTVTTGYDRLVAIGDITWDDYEITVPVTIHDVNGGDGVGVLLRWPGHSVNGGATCTQPKCGYLPLGAICWYRGTRLEIYGNDGDILATQTRSLDLETIYMFKARVETNPGVGGLYSFKVWEQSETEPVGWDITGQEAMSDPQNGSLLLISHHGDVTFGDLSISPIPISITNIQTTVHTSNTGATISWNTSVPASSQVAYGLTPVYELGNISDPTLVTSHSLDLTGLLPDMEYHYQISSVTAGADEAVTGDLMFTTMTSDIVSDDFHLPLLNTSLWTFVDPVGDCDYDLVGSNTADAWLNFLVPAGTEHQLWNDGIQVPHVRQNCNNADFEVEAKFESSLNLQFQEQGILVRQDDDTFMRFEFYCNSAGTRVYVADFDPDGITTHANVEIGPTGMAPLYMRIKRQNDQWAMNYSTDGGTWIQAAIFTFDLTVTTIGPYAGNATGGSSPAHTGSIDYFFNTASPVDPEDPIGDIVVITSEPVTDAIVGQLYTYDVEADGTPPPTFSLETAPAGMSIAPGSGIIEWTPDAPGDYNVSVEASNTIPSMDIQNFVIHVPSPPPPPPSGIVSDDFNDPVLDESIWSFIDPLGGGGYTLTGTCTDNAWINISVPGGSAHELWTNGIMAPHILQGSGDTDFELEVKFESSLSGAYQEQGILIKEDDANFIRFEFYSTASNTNVIAATLTEDSPTPFPLIDEIKFNGSIGSAAQAPLYMRVNRIGNQWTQSWSLDGSNWNVATSFAHTLTVTAVGTYAGNAGGNPAHTSSVDYFFNTAVPASPDDGPCTEWLGTTSTNWSDAGNWSNGIPLIYSNVTIPSAPSNQPHITAPSTSPSQCNRLTIESGASVTIDPGKALTVYRTLTNNSGNDGMLILSDATGTGSLIEQSGVNASVDRYLTEDKWHYISAPVDDPLADVFLDMYMMDWDEPSGQWTYIIDPGYIMETDMQGYAIWTLDLGTVTFTGNLSTGAKSFNTTNTFAASHNSKGFNFTGNPYPSSLNWNVDDGNGWTRTTGDTDPTLYIWNGDVGNYGVYIKDNSTGTNGVDSIIPPHQGFIVHCSAATGFIGVDDGARVHASKDVLKEGAIFNEPVLRLNVSGNEYADEILFRVDAMASIQYDNVFDAIKFRGEPSAPQFYSLSDDDQELSVNAFPDVEEYHIVPIGLEVGTEGIYTISVSEFSGFEQAENMLLEDLKTGVFTKIEYNCIYSFTSSPLDNPERFLLHLNGELDVQEHAEDLVNIYALNKVLYVEVPLDIKGNIIVYNIMGQEIANTAIAGVLNNITIENSAYYVVKVVSDNGVVAKKVLVR